MDLIWVLQLLVLVLAFAAAVFGAAVQVRRVRASVRAWRDARNRPIILADDDALARMPPDWPLRQARWPSPVPSPGERMTPVRCRAYARAAAARSRVARYQAEVVLIISSAFLGFQLPDFLGDVPKMASLLFPLWSAGGAPIAEQPSLGELFLWLLTLVPAYFGLLMGVVLRARSENLDLARAHYERTAEAPQQEELPALEPTQEKGGVWGFLREVAYAAAGSSNAIQLMHPVF